MKLLLTSGGITTPKIAQALKELVGKPDNEIKVGFIPTAQNVEGDDKGWFIDQFTKLHKNGFNWIDVIDISADGVDWKSRLEIVDVIFVCGGNTFYLLDQVRKSGFGEWLKRNLDKKVYVGVSAGSIIMGPKIDVAAIDDGDKNIPEIKDLSGLKIVDFELSPHTPEDVSIETNKEYAKTTDNKVYAYNDNSAVKVVDGSVEIIADGDYLELN